MWFFNSSFSLMRARCDATDRVEDMLSRLLFHHVAARTDLQSAFGIKVLVVDGKHQHRHLGGALAQFLDEFQAVVVLQRDVHHGQIRFLFSHSPQRRGGILRFGADRHVRFVLDEQRQPPAYYRVIVVFRFCSACYSDY